MPMFNPPVGASGVDLDALIAKARAKRAEQEQLKKDSLRIEGLQQAASQMPTTIDPGRNRATVGGVEVDVSAPQEVNWAAPLATLGVAYAGKRAADKEAAAEREAQTAMSEAVGGGLGGDQETQRLMKLAQLGVPGAEQALNAKMQPEKKQPIAGLLQALPNLTPEAADAVAAQYGIPVEQVRSMISGAQQRQQQMSEEEFRREAALRTMGLRPERPSEFELYQQNPEMYQKFQEVKGGNKPQKFDLQGQMADAITAGDTEKFNQLKQVADAMKGRDQVDSVQYPLTPSQKSGQDKRLGELDRQIAASDQFMTDLKRANEIVSNTKNFSIDQKTAWEAYENPAPGIGGVISRVTGATTLRPEVMELNAIFMNKTLEDMAKLGGGDSNEELRKIRSSYPSAMSSPEGARALLERLRIWEEKTREKIWQRRQDIQSGRYYSQRPEDIVTPPPAPAAETAAPPAIKIRSIR